LVEHRTCDTNIIGSNPSVSNTIFYFFIFNKTILTTSGALCCLVLIKKIKKIRKNKQQGPFGKRIYY
jgi:hypothetical protein